MPEVTMLFVGIALINNGACHLLKVDKKSTAALNVIVGFLLTLINFVAIYKGDYYAAGTGLLFAFTHLFVAANNIFNLNLKPYGLYSLFVAINTIPCAMQAASDGMRRRSSGLHGEFSGLPVSSKERHKKKLGKFVPYPAIVEGILTAWIPGFLLLAGKW